MHAKCGLLQKVPNVDRKVCKQDVISWSSVISGCVQHGYYEEALNYFMKMQEEKCFPNAYTYSSVLKACGNMRDFNKGIKFHEDIIGQGYLEHDIVLGNALLGMYVKWGHITKAQEVMHCLPAKNLISWSTLISGFARQGQGQEAFSSYMQMLNEGVLANSITYISILNACANIRDIDKGKMIHTEILTIRSILDSNAALGNVLVDMYGKCSEAAKSRQVFEELPLLDIISWNSLISAYSQAGHDEEALNCLRGLQNQGFLPNAVTFTSILKVFGSTVTIEKGKQIHSQILCDMFLAKDIVLGTALVDMYAKCGVLSEAEKVLNWLPAKNICSWNALISGYAQHGHGEEALSCFKWMLAKCSSPDAVTFLGVLTACCHSGLLSEGQMYFASMSQKYGITPTLEHHACMVDLFGRAGHLDKAMTIISKTKCSDYLPMWGALLAACQKWEDVKLGKLVFEELVQLDNANTAPYICMTNMYLAAGMLEDAHKIEIMRSEVS